MVLIKTKKIRVDKNDVYQLVENLSNKGKGFFIECSNKQAVISIKGVRHRDTNQISVNIDAWVNNRTIKSKQFNSSVSFHKSDMQSFHVKKFIDYAFAVLWVGSVGWLTQMDIDK